MKDRTHWLRGSSVVLIVCIAAVSACSGLPSQQVTRSPAVDTYDLMLDRSVSPSGWDMCAGPEPLPKRERGESESLLVWFCPPDFDGVGGTHQEVYKYRNELEATWAYNPEFQAREFPMNNMTTPWAVPDEWSYQSPVADQFRFACGEQDSGLYPTTVCVAVAQYDEYVSVLVTHPSCDDVTLRDVERILIAIDERMAFYLGKDTQ
jgi:hypothetical protein